MTGLPPLDDDEDEEEVPEEQPATATAIATAAAAAPTMRLVRLGERIYGAFQIDSDWDRSRV
ncbi:hypothetical protein LLS1_37340 [Leifsonia sp. LS1]|nr:hypothetical protein LLS1_37340 [Leifsonia sp. LS1]